MTRLQAVVPLEDARRRAEMEDACVAYAAAQLSIDKGPSAETTQG